jgi:hypothetical protein
MEKAFRTEDEVRDSAKLVLGFDKTEDGAQQGTGQITTFNQLGFRGCNDKPDGWYLPDDASKPAIILETKSEAEGVSKEKHVKELFKNIDVVAKKYSKTIGILYSGGAIRVFRNKIELSDVSKRLENKDYYIRLCTSQKLDSNYIFEIKLSNAQLRMLFMTGDGKEKSGRSPNSTQSTAIERAANRFNDMKKRGLLDGNIHCFCVTLYGMEYYRSKTADK